MEGAALFQEPEFIGGADGEIEIVGGEKDGGAVAMGKAAQGAHDVDAAGQIEEGGDLIKDEEFGLLCEGASHEDLLALAVTEFVDGAGG
jgi:hypothetical protein